MLSILHRYVMWELVRSFVVSFASLVGLMLLGSLGRMLRLGIGLNDLAKLIPFLLPYLYAWVIPAALLSACVMAYGRLSADNELTAVRASGIPLRYMCYPALVLGLLLTALALPLNDWVIPHCAILKERELRRIFLEEPFRVSLLGSDITTRIGGHRIYVESVDGKILRNVVVIEPKETERVRSLRKRVAEDEAREREGQADPPEEGPEVNVYRAEWAKYDFEPERNKMRLEFHNAQVVMVWPGRSAREWVQISADEQVKEIPVASLDATVERRGSLTTGQLLARAAEKRREAAQGGAGAARARKEVVRAITEVRLREALAFSTLALCLVGVPIGMWIRRQSRLASFAIGILVFVGLYGMLLGGEGLAVEQRLPPWLALWTPDALMGALGLGLLFHQFRH
ncbi:MAG: YjgP/YjgQ family permease [Planctomycetes bacterium]|nr:YjgP/YjgQ family permease [Planctomycetota bacterium]